MQDYYCNRVHPLMNLFCITNTLQPFSPCVFNFARMGMIWAGSDPSALNSCHTQNCSNESHCRLATETRQGKLDLTHIIPLGHTIFFVLIRFHISYYHVSNTLLSFFLTTFLNLCCKVNPIAYKCNYHFTATIFA